jgi:hypothetical protein
MTSVRFIRDTVCAADDYEGGFVEEIILLAAKVKTFGYIFSDYGDVWSVSVKVNNDEMLLAEFTYKDQTLVIEKLYSFDLNEFLTDNNKYIYFKRVDAWKRKII